MKRSLLNTISFFSNLRNCICFTVCIAHKIAANPWAINVARPTPNTPILNTITKTKSNIVFIIQEIIKKYKGDFESPTDRSK